jgi:hypothetical protein
MKFAACFLVLAAGVCSATPANEPQTPAAQPTAPTAPGALSATGDTKPAPGAPSGAGDTKPAPSASSAGDVKPAPGPPAAPDPKADKSAVANAGPTDAQIKLMRSRGYKPVTRNGTMVFCRAEGEIGTHFQRTRCSTLDELKQAELSGKEFVNSIQQQGSAVPFKGP